MSSPKSPEDESYETWESAPWRCLYCGDRLPSGQDCKRSQCVELYKAAQKRMAIYPDNKKPLAKRRSY